MRTRRLAEFKEDFKILINSTKRLNDKYIMKHWPGYLSPIREFELIDTYMSLTKKIQDPFVMLKWMCMLHCLILTRCTQHQHLLSKLIEIQSIHPLLDYEAYERILSMSKDSEQDKTIQILLVSQVIKPYLGYINSRLMKSELIQKPVHINLDLEYESLENIISCFELINLLKKGASFCNYFYTLGRYFENRYPFIRDFNIIIGMDYRTCYQKLRNLSNRLQSKFKQLQPNMQRQVNVLSQEIAELNEGLFKVYMNNYFYQQVREFMPNAWIRFDPREESPSLDQRSVDRKANSHSTCHTCSCGQNRFTPSPGDNSRLVHGLPNRNQVSSFEPIQEEKQGQDTNMGLMAAKPQETILDKIQINS